MAASPDAVITKSNKYRLNERSLEEKQKLLEGKDKVTTQRATKGYMEQFRNYLSVKNLPKVEDLDPADLNDILSDFYSSVKPQKKEEYSVQSLKCLRAGLNRYFRKEKGIDITADSQFVKANEMFEAVKVDSKKKGRGVRVSYPPITNIDLERIAEYFCHDHVTVPDARRLQQNMIFYIIYFFCRRGRENLYNMTRDTFKLVVEPDGVEYFIQNIDEMDKNHGADDKDKTNEGKMYATYGKKFFYNAKTLNI